MLGQARGPINRLSQNNDRTKSKTKKKQCDVLANSMDFKVGEYCQRLTTKAIFSKLPSFLMHKIRVTDISTTCLKEVTTLVFNIC